MMSRLASARLNCSSRRAAVPCHRRVRGEDQPEGARLAAERLGLLGVDVQRAHRLTRDEQLECHDRADRRLGQRVPPIEREPVFGLAGPATWMVFSSHAAVRHGPSRWRCWILSSSSGQLCVAAGVSMCLALRVSVMPGVLRAGDLDGGVLCQFGDHGVGIGVGPAVQSLHKLGDAQMCGFHPGLIVHRHRPIVERLRSYRLPLTTTDDARTANVDLVAEHPTAPTAGVADLIASVRRQRIGQRYKRPQIPVRDDPLNQRGDRGAQPAPPRRVPGERRHLGDTRPRWPGRSGRGTAPHRDSACPGSVP